MMLTQNGVIPISPFRSNEASLGAEVSRSFYAYTALTWNCQNAPTHSAGCTWLWSAPPDHVHKTEPQESFLHPQIPSLCCSVLVTPRLRVPKPAFTCCAKHRGAVCSKHLFNLNSDLLVSFCGLCDSVLGFQFPWWEVLRIKEVLY